VKTLGYPCSISETFLRRNQNQSLAENQAVLGRIKELADEAGLQMVAYISMVFGNPYEDPWSEATVVEAAIAIARAGITAISLADTVGAAEPELIQRIVSAVQGECARSEIGVHLHSTRTGAAAKVLAAFDAGCRRFDSALGGLGGCPFAQDSLVGNIPTEEVLRALQQRGVTVRMNDSLERVVRINHTIGKEFAGDA
jgi:hydroxymethylglutaryl-CoA lyase